MKQFPSFDAMLRDPRIYEVNTVPAHSDHIFYSDEAHRAADDRSDLCMSLDGAWYFHYTRGQTVSDDAFYAPGRDLKGWETINVPSHVQMAGYETPKYVNTQYPWDGHRNVAIGEVYDAENAQGDYARYFTLPETMRGRTVRLRFEGAEPCVMVWLNGAFVGYSEDSFTPSEFDLTPYLDQTGENKLCVRVTKWCSGIWLEDQDFWRFFGIFRSVALWALPETHIDDVFVKTELSDDFARADVRACVRLAAGAPAEVRAELYDPDGALAAKACAHIDGSGEVTLPLSAPSLWSAESPALYELRLSAAGGEVCVLKVGVRRFELIDRVMHLNGRRIVFKGVDRHEWNARRGRAVTEEDMLWDIRFLKANNFNAVRTSHYPNSTLWYRLCDEYGIYLVDETNIETHGTWQGSYEENIASALPGDKPEWEGACLFRARNMFERDKNHASILLWSCGNESFGGSVLYKVSAFFRTNDPSRLVHYEGVRNDPRWYETTDVETRMYPPAAEVEEYLLSENPPRPVLLCEYAHAMGNSVGALEKYTGLSRRYPMYQGGFIWDFIDQAVETADANGRRMLAYGGDFGERPCDWDFSGDGVIFADRVPSPKMQAVRALYSDHIVTVTKDAVKIVNESAFTNTEQYALALSVARDGKVLSARETSLFVPPQESGELALDLPEYTVPGEYVVTASLRLREDTPWAARGHELAFGQYAFCVEDTRVPARRAVRVEDCTANVGLWGENFGYLFEKKSGRLISITVNGRELIETPLTQAFWRASTANDRGANLMFEQAQWLGADRFSRLDGFETETGERAEDTRLTAHFTLPTVPETKLDFIYTLLPDGALRVEMRYAGAPGLGAMPRFGAKLALARAYRHVRWYGLGPEENYPDRAAGAKLGLYETDADAMVSKYLNPQECGGRTGTRYVELTDGAGRGLRVEMADAPFQFSALPYTALELESAAHPNELPLAVRTVLTLDGCHMGVAGDDSWGARPHPEYMVDAGKAHAFSFILRPIAR